MARVLTTKDAYSIMNLLVKEATGQDAQIQVVDSSTFVSAGETVMATGVENVLNSISLLAGKTLVAARPFTAKLALIQALNTGVYTHRFRKISVLSKYAVIDGASNTDLKTNLADGYDNGSNGGQSAASMWEQHRPVVAEFNFAGSSEWQYPITWYEYQLKTAFRSEEEFLDFWSGIMTEAANDMECEREAFRRMTLLNFIAGLYDLNAVNGSAINMTAAYNAKFGTTYTTAQLQTTHLTEFLEFFVSEFKTISNNLTNRSKKYHWSPSQTIGSDTYELLRHTPKNKQKCIMLERFWNDAEAQVKPAIFNPQYLDIANFETVQFWQNENEPSKIDVTPAIPDVANPTAQKVGDNVKLGYVLGIIFDEDAILTDMQLEDAAVTPVEARKRYRNTWYTFAKNAINDFTENAVLFYMAD